SEWQRDTLVESSWKPWLPAGGFHFLTKDAPYVGAGWTAERKMSALPTTPPPPQFKAIDNADPIALPLPEIDTDSFFETLHARKTHRTFAQGKLSLGNVSKLLKTTWGVQGYIETNVFGRLPHKT